MQSVLTLARSASFEVAQFLSPEGTAVDSQGRKPLENRTYFSPSPEGATRKCEFTFVPPLWGFGSCFVAKTWG